MTAQPIPRDIDHADVRGYVELVEYRSRVGEDYAAVRRSEDPRRAWERWRRRRDDLFANHPQSPLDPEERTPGYSTPFAPYDPAYRVVAHPRPGRGDDVTIEHSDGATTRFIEVASFELRLPPGRVDLALYWLPGYGGGYFLPFRDATAGSETYGGGRYLLDSVKGADLGSREDGLILDFNFAYHPSCRYNDRWSCPLAPRRNHLDVPIRVGEQLP